MDPVAPTELLRPSSSNSKVAAVTPFATADMSNRT